MLFHCVWTVKSQTQAPVWENLSNKSISRPPLAPPPAPLRWLAPSWRVFHPGELRLVQAAAHHRGAPGSSFGQQRRTAAPLLCCLVRRAAEGSGVRASCCASVDQRAAAAAAAAAAERFFLLQSRGHPGERAATPCTPRTPGGGGHRFLLPLLHYYFDWLRHPFISFPSW